jgi:hypothetical protein
MLALILSELWDSKCLLFSSLYSSFSHVSLPKGICITLKDSNLVIIHIRKMMVVTVGICISSGVKRTVT